MPPIPEKPGWDGVEELASMLMFASSAYGLRDTLDEVHRTATLVRDQISHDAWRMLSALHIDRRWRQPKRAGLTWPLLELLDDGIRSLNAFSGTESENMTRNFAWRFLQIGRRIERSDVMLNLLQAGILHARQDDIVLGPLLEIGDSTMTYRRLHFARPMLIQTLDLLLLEPGNPRSFSFQLHALDRLMAKLPHDATQDAGNREREQTDALLSDLMALNLEKLATAGDLVFEVAPHFCQKMTKGIETLSDIITEHFFSHASVRGR